MLTAGRLKELFAYNAETGIFKRRVRTSNAVGAGDIAGSLSDGYLRICIDGQSYKAHRLAWYYVHGTWPSGQLDHINGNRSDNRIANLREATQSEQNANAGRRSDNTTGYRGVSFHKASGKYTARVMRGGKLVYASYHDAPEDAATAYRAASLAHHGKFAVAHRQIESAGAEERVVRD